MKEIFPAFTITNDCEKKYSLIHDCAELPFLHNNAVLQEMEILEFDDSYIKIAKPNVILLFISNAKKSDEEGNKLASKILKGKEIKEGSSFEEQLRLNTEIVYEYIAIKSNSAINAYQAIEAFCNLTIPDDYIYTKKTKRATEHYNKTQIERHFSTSDKLKNIICNDIYGINDIEKTVEWKMFLSLEKIRHELIHQKSNKTKKLLNVLLTSNKGEFSDSAKRLIWYIVDKILKDIVENKTEYDYNIVSKLPQFQNIKVLFGRGIGWKEWDEDIIEKQKMYKAIL